MTGFAGLAVGHPALIPQEFPLLPVVEGSRLFPQSLGGASGYVVVLAMADVLPVAGPKLPVPAVTPVPGREEALNGPLLMVALAV